VPAEDEILKRKQERLKPQNQAVHKRDEQLKAAARAAQGAEHIRFPNQDDQDRVEHDLIIDWPCV